MNMQTNLRGLTTRPGRAIPLFGVRSGLRASRLADVRTLLDAGRFASASQAADALALIAPLDPDVLLVRAECAVARHDPLAAIPLLDQALGLRDSKAIWAAKGRALMAADHVHRAGLAFARARALGPLARSDMENYVECLRQSGRPRDALGLAKTMNDTAPLAMALAAADCAKPETVVKHLLLALAQTPSDPKALALAHRYRYALSPEQMSDLVDATLAEDTPTPAALSTLATMCAPADAVRIADRADKAIKRANPDPANHVHLNHALYRAADMMDQPDQAMSYLRAAHATAVRTDATTAQAAMAALAYPERFEFAAQSNGKTGRVPIFVVGLPGAGVEGTARLIQTAASSAAVRTLPSIRKAVARALQSSPPPQTGPAQRQTVGRDVLMEIASSVRSILAQVAGGEEVIVNADRNLAPLVGLLCAALPEARVVHVTRDPVHTVWSHLRLNPLSDGGLAVTDDRTLAALHCTYAHTMTYWKSRFPRQIIEVSADALARPSRQSARALLEAIGLNWTERCVAPDYAPARDWHRYAAHLSPLRIALRQMKGTTRM